MRKDFNRLLLIFSIFLPLAAQALPQEPNQTGLSADAHTVPPEIRIARQALRKACASDAARLCSGIAHGGGHIRTCLRDHRTDLSQECLAAWQELRMARRDVAR